MDIAITPITELIKSSIPLLKRQINYIVHSKRKFRDLKEKVEELERTRNDVRRRVDAARRNVESIHEVVEAWLVKVDKETTRDGDDQTILGLIMSGEAVNMINTKCWCSCGSGSRYNLGRKAEKKMFIVDELLNEGKSFGGNVSSPCVIDINPMSISNPDDFEPFASREHLRGQIMESLQDEATNLIGVYGMGGVGKTTLVTQVYDQVKKEKDLFDEVVMTTISQNLDLRKIQNDLAEMLELRDMKGVDSPLARANLLLERLKQKNTLVILDDLWSDLNLFHVGIPCGGNHHKVCKVIITTRRLEVCTSLDSKKNVNVEVLSDDDAWKLFIKNVGNLADYTDLGTMAREIAKECGGLPVALVTLGKGLRSKKKHRWDNTLRELRNSKTPLIEGMEPKVFSSIKLSYDFLGEEICKKCFLLCCLFPEDHEIYVSDLMAYVVGDDMMFEDDAETLKQITDMINTVLDKLVDSCLLLRKEHDNGLYAVSMHDVIRDVAINIASHQEPYRFLIKAGVGLKDWPKRSLLSITSTGKGLRRLSLIGNEITVLPNDQPPELSDLLSLSLYKNKSLKEIPDSFFQRVGSLATLDLQQTGISLLPSSLSFLVNLKTLYLGGCKFNQSTDISVIGKLKKLEILSLANCLGLQGLPEEIRELTNLRFLNLGGCSRYDFIIPKNVISSLSRLEYLNTYYCKIKWEVEEWGNDGQNATLVEVASLPCLSGLLLNFNHGGAGEFFIAFSDASDIICTYDFDTTSKCVNVSPPVCHPIKLLIQKVEFLSLRRCTGLKSVGQLGAGFNYLMDLDVEECRELEYVMSVAEAEINPRPFVALEELTLDRLYSLKKIFVGPIPVGFVDKLRTLHINGCHSMVSVFDANSVKSAPNLEFLDVSRCDCLKNVFTLEEIETLSVSTLNIEDQDEAGLTNVKFSRLRKMKLDKLPILENIWKGYIPDGCFEKLEKINIRDCPELRYLFSSSMARNLRNLMKLGVCRCSSMVKLIASSERIMDNQLMLKIFPNLKQLSIWDCENLKQLWDTGKNLEKKEDDVVDDHQLAVPGRPSILDFPALEYLILRDCKRLKRIHLTHRCTEQLKRITGDSEEWFEEVLEWENPNDKQHMRALLYHYEAYEERLRLISAHYMVSVFNHNLVKRVPDVKSLYVDNCYGLKDVFNLEEIGSTSTTLNIQEALSDFTFSELREIRLHNLPILENIWKGNIPSVGCLKNLKIMEVCGCHQLSYLFSMSMARNLQNLEELIIDGCSGMVKLIASGGIMVYDHDEEEPLSFNIFPKLKKLIIVSCENLKQLWDHWDGKNLEKKKDYGNATDDVDQLVVERVSILDFPYLEYLEVRRCENLKRIYLTHQGKQQLKQIIGDNEEWFQGIEWENPSDKLHMRPLFSEEGSLEIISAPYMHTVYNLNLVKRVPYVKSLNVIKCFGLENVFSLEEIRTSTLNIEVALSDFTFSKLREMKLYDLPHLENIWKGYIPFGCFWNLGQMKVHNCDTLRYLFSISMAKNLQNFQELEIWNCRSMVKLVISDEQTVCDDDGQLLLKIFPNLKKLIIVSCESLKQLWDIEKNSERKENDDAGNELVKGPTSILDFPHLEDLQVHECENWKRIHLTHRSTRQLKQIIGDSEEWFERLEWENLNDKLNMKHLFKEWKEPEKQVEEDEEKD